MDFPELLDAEDMELFLKEWRLSGGEVEYSHSCRQVERVDQANEIMLVEMVSEGWLIVNYKKAGSSWKLTTNQVYPDDFGAHDG